MVLLSLLKLYFRPQLYRLIIAPKLRLRRQLRGGIILLLLGFFKLFTFGRAMFVLHLLRPVVLNLI